ncbi:MAG TPA: hypothetical protein ENK14_12035, partial [Caldithrix sp.]|nr:hypothetical protein [Caldithrix sp.]
MKPCHRLFGRWAILTLLSIILTNGVEASQLVITPQEKSTYLQVQGKDFQPLDKIRSVVVFAYDYGGNLINRMYIADYELYCDTSGRLFGKIPTAGIPAEASRLHVKIATAESGIVEADFNFDLNTQPVQPMSPPTSVTIDDDQNGSGTADPGEVIKFSGSGWGGTAIRRFYQKEYSDIGGTNLLATVRIRDYSSKISGGDLSGNYTTPSSFTAGAKSIRINLIDDASSEATSAPYIIAESDPPEITSSTAINLMTIQVVFDESLYEKNGDAGERFILTGSDVSGVSISSLEPVGSEPTDTWNIILNSNLADRDPDGVTVAYDSTTSSSDPQLQDPAGNQVKNESSSGVADGIAPADPTRISPSATDDFESGVVKWSATADDNTTDPSISYLQIEGSDDLSSWTAVGSQDNSVTSTSYQGSYSPGVEYAYYRIMAVDDQGNESYSSVTVKYQDAHHLSITSDPVNEPVNMFEDQVTFEVRDAYGNLETVTKTVDLSMLSGTGTPTFRQTPTGSDITQIDLVNAGSGSFYFACNVAGTKEIGISTTGLVATSQNATISGIASKILIKLPGQSFVNGSGIIGPVTAQQAGTSFNVTLYIVDSDNYVVDTETGSRAIDFTSNTGNAPDGTQPTINGNTPDVTDVLNWSDISIGFSAGVSDNVAIILYKSGSGVNFTASDNSGSPTLTGETSSNLTVNPAALNDFVFAVTTPQIDGLPVSGTNTLTARDVYQNVKTDFDASATPVTIAKNSGPGTLSVKGLHGTSGDELNQADDFSQGVANLTSLGMRLDVSAEGTYQIKATVGGTDKGSSGNIAIDFRTAVVSNPTPAADANIDASASNSDLSLSADVSQGELTTYDYNDDFQIRWGFTNNAD